MRAVNLLPADRTVASGARDREPRSRKPLLIACARARRIVTIAGLSTAVWSSNSSVSAKQKQLEALQTQIASIPTPGVPPARPPTPRRARRRSRASSATGSSGTSFLQTLSKVMPEDVWLQSLQVTTAGAAATLAQQQAAAAAAAAAAARGADRARPTLAPPAPPPRTADAVASTFTITGFTYSQPSVARLMRRLDIVPWLQDVSLVSSSKSHDRQRHRLPVHASRRPSYPTPEGA